MWLAVCRVSAFLIRGDRGSSRLRRLACIRASPRWCLVIGRHGHPCPLYDSPSRDPFSPAPALTPIFGGVSPIAAAHPGRCSISEHSSALSPFCAGTAIHPSRCPFLSHADLSSVCLSSHMRTILDIDSMRVWAGVETYLGMLTLFISLPSLHYTRINHRSPPPRKIVEHDGPTLLPLPDTKDDGVDGDDSDDDTSSRPVRGGLTFLPIFLRDEERLWVRLVETIGTPG